MKGGLPRGYFHGERPGGGVLAFLDRNGGKVKIELKGEKKKNSNVHQQKLPGRKN